MPHLRVPNAACLKMLSSSAVSTIRTKSRRRCSISGCACCCASITACSGSIANHSRRSKTSSVAQKRTASRFIGLSSHPSRYMTSILHACARPISFSTARLIMCRRNLQRCALGRTACPHLRGRNLCEPHGGQSTDRRGAPRTRHYSLADYEALAVRLATEPDLLSDMQHRLIRGRATMPLFDMSRFTANLERAYREDSRHPACRRTAANSSQSNRMVQKPSQVRKSGRPDRRNSTPPPDRDTRTAGQLRRSRFLEVSGSIEWPPEFKSYARSDKPRIGLAPLLRDAKDQFGR